MRKLAQALLLCILISMFIGVGAASAETILGPYTASFPATNLPWSTTLNVPKVSPALCPVLTNVHIEFDTHTEGDVLVENISAAGADITTRLDATLLLKKTAGQVLLSSTPTMSHTDNIAAGGSKHYTTADFTVDDSQSTDINSANLNAWKGTGTYNYPVTASGSFSASGTNPIRLTLTTAAGATAKVWYTCVASTAVQLSSLSAAPDPLAALPHWAAWLLKWK